MSQPSTPSDPPGQTLDICDPTTALLHRAERVTDDYLAATIRLPGLSIEAVPDQVPYWRVAHCCRTIAVRIDQTYPEILDSVAAALDALHHRADHGPPIPPCPVAGHRAPPPAGPAVRLDLTDELARRRSTRHP